MHPSETREDVTVVFRDMFNLMPPQAFNTDHLVHIGNTLLDENARLLETLHHETDLGERLRLLEPILQSLIGTFHHSSVCPTALSTRESNKSTKNVGTRSGPQIRAV